MSDKQAKLGAYAQAIMQLMVEKWQHELGQVQAALAADPTLVAQGNYPSQDRAAVLGPRARGLPASGAPARCCP